MAVDVIRMYCICEREGCCRLHISLFTRSSICTILIKHASAMPTQDPNMQLKLVHVYNLPFPKEVEHERHKYS